MSPEDAVRGAGCAVVESVVNAGAIRPDSRDRPERLQRDFDRLLRAWKGDGLSRENSVGGCVKRCPRECRVSPWCARRWGWAREYFSYDGVEAVAPCHRNTAGGGWP